MSDARPPWLEPPRGWLFEPDDANTWTDDAVERRGRCLVTWADEDPPAPLDRYGRTVDEIRAHLERVADVRAGIEHEVERCGELELGREAGPKFWQRWDVQLAVLDRGGT